MAKILIADDEASLRDALGIILRHAGYEVRMATDGAQAVSCSCGSAPTWWCST